MIIFQHVIFVNPTYERRIFCIFEVVLFTIKWCKHTLWLAEKALIGSNYLVKSILFTDNIEWSTEFLFAQNTLRIRGSIRLVVISVREYDAYVLVLMCFMFLHVFCRVVEAFISNSLGFIISCYLSLPTLSSGKEKSKS